MKTLLLLLFAFNYCTGMYAQKEKFVTVKEGNNIIDVLTTSEVLHYPDFINGKVIFRNGTRAEAKLNYNRIFDEIHFIDPKGDTLAIIDEMNIKHVLVGNDTFYYNSGGYLRLLSSNNLVKLAIKQVWTIANTRQIGALNSTNNSVGMTSYTSYQQGGRLYDLTVNADLVLKKVEQYYFGDNNNHFVIASKKNLQLLFPKEEEPIARYLKNNKINFSSKDDLEKVMQFLKLL